MKSLLTLALSVFVAGCAADVDSVSESVEHVDSVENELTRCIEDLATGLPKLCTYDRPDGAGIGGKDIALSDGRTDCYRKESWVTPDRDCYLSKGWHMDGVPSAIRNAVLVRDNYALIDRAVLVWNVTKYGNSPRPCQDRMQNVNVCGF